MPADERYFSGRAPIDAYGNGGFRFAEMSHRGSLMFLPSGIYAWDVDAFDKLNARSFLKVFAEAAQTDFLLLGTGARQRLPDEKIRAAFEKSDIGLEFMDTGAACRTYNVILAEGRAVAAAVIAVD